MKASFVGLKFVWVDGEGLIAGVYGMSPEECRLAFRHEWKAHRT